MKKKFLNGCKLKSLLHGAYVAAGTAIATAAVPMLETGSMPSPHQFKYIGSTALIAGLVYIAKNIFAGSSEKINK